MTETEIIDLFRSSNALFEGHFELSSGRHSDRYVQCALVLQDPPSATLLGAALGEFFHSFKPLAAVVAPALGGILVAHEVARELHTRAIFTERINGQMTLRRGFALQPGDPVVVVEDVITTGLSTRETIQAIQQTGAHVVAAGSLVDRSGGEVSRIIPVPLHSLISVPVKSFTPGECPLCQKEIPIVKPGSRV